MTIHRLKSSVLPALKVILILVTATTAAGQSIFVANYTNGSNGLGTIGQYTTSGTAVNPSLVTGLNGPMSVAFYGGNLFATNYSSGTIGQYTTSGTPVNPSFVSGLNGPDELAFAGGFLYVVNTNTNTVRKYDSDGNLLNALFVNGLNGPSGLAIAGGDLFVANYNSGVVGKYDLSTGVAVTAPFVTVPGSPTGIAISGGYLYVVDRTAGAVHRYDVSNPATGPATYFVSGFSGFPYCIAILDNTLFVGCQDGTVGTYDASTGAVLNPALIVGLNGPSGFAIVAIPEPSTYAALFGLTALGFAAFCRRHRQAA
jgi:WD40 repeat protein